jgi:DNA-binding transcriptional LysR family regulator
MNDAPAIPFNALHAVLMVARHGALGPAAEALGVTPGAVSQHIKRAEARAGVLLFERKPTGLVPTAALNSALSDLETGFGALRRVEGRLAGPAQANVLTVTAGNVFASRWLVWRLGDFSARHRDIELRLMTTGALVDLARPDIDCGIRFGSGDWPGVDAIPLGGREMFPVCAPALAQRLRTPADLADVPIIRDPTGMLSWDDWLTAAGVGDLPCSGPSFSDPALAFDAAVAGQGVLLAVAAMADYALKHGQLVRPFEVTVSTPHGYWFATAKDHELPARTRKFRDWLVGQMAPHDG